MRTVVFGCLMLGLSSIAQARDASGHRGIKLGPVSVTASGSAVEVLPPGCFRSIFPSNKYYRGTFIDCHYREALGYTSKK